LKIDPWGHVSTLNIETRSVEFRPFPLRIEPGRGILIINPVQNSTTLKHVISTPMVYSIKNLNLIPGFTILFVYFAFDSLCHKILKSFDRSFPLSFELLKIKKKLKTFIHHLYIRGTFRRQEPHPLFPK
jgi:hypothetical protein